MSNLCMGCMNALPEGSEICPVCGYPVGKDNPAHGLHTGTVLQEHYLVGRLMSQGSDSLVYMGFDRTLKEPCFIQEYFPGTLAERDEAGAVRPAGGCAAAFDEYREAFHDMARSLARVKELPNMIAVYDLFEENGTVYTVSDYCPGMTLSKKIKNAGGRIPWAEARPLFMALMTLVSQLHSAHIRHLSICPDNILISPDGKPHLRNFSIMQAHCAGTDIEPALVAGFAAPEQYAPFGSVGVTDATDVYGLAATLFYTVTGNVPPTGNQRAKNSDDLFMSAEIANELTQSVCGALFNALLVNPGQRTETVAQLQEELGTEPHVSALRDEAEQDLAEEEAENAPRSKRTIIIIFVTALAVLAVLAIGIFALLGSGRDPGSDGNPLPTITRVTKAPKEEPKYSVEDYVGKSYYEERDKDHPGGLIIHVRYNVYSEQPAGTIVWQSMDPGTVIQNETTMEVDISLGRKDDQVKIPNVTGWKSEHAKAYLEALGFKVEVKMLQVSNYEKGLVDSTDPAIGETLRIGDTVTLRVSNVEQQIEEPDPYENEGYTE